MPGGSICAKLRSQIGRHASAAGSQCSCDPGRAVCSISLEADSSSPSWHADQSARLGIGAEAGGLEHCGHTAGRPRPPMGGGMP